MLINYFYLQIPYFSHILIFLAIFLFEALTDALYLYVFLFLLLLVLVTLHIARLNSVLLFLIQ